MSPADVIAAALRALETGRGVAIAAVVGVSGSTPRHLGARMAVADDGEQWGTVGGGKIEQLVVAAAREVAGGAAPRVVRQHLVRDLAMCCGGAMEVAITPAAPSREAIERLVAAIGRQRRAVCVDDPPARKRKSLQSPVSSPQDGASLGDRRLETGDLSPIVLVTPLDGSPLEVREVRDGDPKPHRPQVVDGALVERLGDAERVVLFGLGHVARELGPLLSRLGFSVVVCDDGDTGALAAAPPAWAASVIESFDAAEVERVLGGFSPGDHVLIVTRDHAIDQQLLETLITRDDLGYLGMIGSRGKVGRFRKRLEAKGLYDEARWQRLRAPIGLDIGAETPEEIAVAIAAELVAQRRRGIAAAGDWRIRRDVAE
jgi:xanthine dehydrogenase accessory factor